MFLGLVAMSAAAHFGMPTGINARQDAFRRAPAWRMRRPDVAAVAGCQKALASGSMIGLLPDRIAAAKDDVCGSRRCM